MRLHVEALYALDPNMARESWVRIAFAFKDAGGTLEEFLDWSALGGNFNREDCVSTWRNAKAVPGGVTEATLFMEARKAGWKPAAAGNGAGGAPIAQLERPKRRLDVAAAAAPPVLTDPTPAWEASVPTVSHPYLTRKGIGAHGARQTSTGSLAVAFVNPDGKIQTIQFIADDGTKRFLKGAKAKGAVCIAGGEPRAAANVCIAEGFATAAAIHEATGYPAIASGSRVTMPDAARIARLWAPQARLIVCADRGDMSTPIAAARAVGAVLAVPGPMDAADGFDFCDWRLDGAKDDEIRARIDQSRAPALPVNPDDDGRFADVPTDGAAEARSVAARAKLAFLTDGKGRIVSNLENLTRYLRAGELGEFATDTFTGVQLWKGQPIVEADYGAVCCLAQHFPAFRMVSITMTMDAIAQAASANAFNSNVRWLESLAPWDGTERIAQFFVDVAGCHATDYVLATGRYFWLSLVGRMARPGAGADAVVVMIGAQGIGKSRLAQTIGGERYGDISLAEIGTRDWCAQLRGKIIVEFSELSGHTRAELETIKAVLSRQVDDYRPAYARTVASVPRGCIFFGTTNETDFLIDYSGNRRWLPIDAKGAIPLDAVAAMREQLFAEAFAAIQSDTTTDFWTVPGATQVQEEHVVRDPWIDVLDEGLRDLNAIPCDVVTTLRCYEVLKIPAERRTGGGTGRRIAAAMRALGYQAYRRRPDGGGPVQRGFERLKGS